MQRLALWLPPSPCSCERQRSRPCDTSGSSGQRAEQRACRHSIRDVGRFVISFEGRQACRRRPSIAAATSAQSRAVALRDAGRIRPRARTEGRPTPWRRYARRVQFAGSANAALLRAPNHAKVVPGRTVCDQLSRLGRDEGTFGSSSRGQAPLFIASAARLFSSPGATSSTWVAIQMVLPLGSLTPPERSP